MSLGNESVSLIGCLFAPNVGEFHPTRAFKNMHAFTGEGATIQGSTAEFYSFPHTRSCVTSSNLLLAQSAPSFPSPFIMLSCYALYHMATSRVDSWLLSLAWRVRKYNSFAQINTYTHHRSMCLFVHLFECTLLFGTKVFGSKVYIWAQLYKSMVKRLLASISFLSLLFVALPSFYNGKLCEPEAKKEEGKDEGKK